MLSHLERECMLPVFMRLVRSPRWAGAGTGHALGARRRGPVVDVLRATEPPRAIQSTTGRQAVCTAIDNAS